MISFRLKRNLLISGFIIVSIAIMWPSTQTPVAPQTATSDSPEANSNYLEKIDGFMLQEFDQHNRLSYRLESEQYLNSKDQPALLLMPKVSTYDQQAKLDYVLTSDKAQYLESGEIRFQGKVQLRTADGTVHHIKTEELLVDVNTDDLISHKPVTYLGQGVRALSQGMHMRTKDDQLSLTGEATLYQDSGSQVLTQDLQVNQSGDQQRYYSNHQTQYVSDKTQIDAEGLDMDTQTQQLQLLGNSTITQDSGSVIKAQNLQVDQSGDQEVYMTKDEINYQSEIANIKAQQMHYDAKAQKIQLEGGVVGQYE